MSVKGGVYAYEAYGAKKIKIFFLLCTYIYYLHTHTHTHTHTHEETRDTSARTRNCAGV